MNLSRNILIVFAATAFAAMIVIFAGAFGVSASEQPLKLFEDVRRVSVWIDPETKCHYLIVSAYGGNGGPNNFSITPRMRPIDAPLGSPTFYGLASKHWCD